MKKKEITMIIRPIKPKVHFQSITNQYFDTLFYTIEIELSQLSFGAQKCFATYFTFPE